VFDSEELSYEEMYTHPDTKCFLNKGYVFYHDPDTCFKRFKAKFLDDEHEPYIALFLDSQNNVLGFNIGIIYPSLLRLMFHEGWLDRYHYSSVPQFIKFETWYKQFNGYNKLLFNIKETIANHKTEFEDFEVNGNCFSPNALGIFRNARTHKALSELNKSLFNSLDYETRKLPFVFETTVKDRIHDFFKVNGCAIVQGTLSNPYQEKSFTGDSVVTIGNYSIFINRFVPFFHRKN
jgi:hypothetical protein